MDRRRIAALPPGPNKLTRELLREEVVVFKRKVGGDIYIKLFVVLVRKELNEKEERQPPVHTVIVSGHQVNVTPGARRIPPKNVVIDDDGDGDPTNDTTGVLMQGAAWYQIVAEESLR